MIFIIDDDRMMAECIARYAKPHQTRIFDNAIEAMNSLDKHLPDLIFLDILLPGPDGFTFLNELASYADTAKIPIVIISSLNMKKQDLSNYGVVGQLSKDTMTPEEVKQYVSKYAK
jgi:CheY-like chemotaxis protein